MVIIGREFREINAIGWKNKIKRKMNNPHGNIYNVVIGPQTITVN